MKKLFFVTGNDRKIARTGRVLSS
ncbi:MAG: hypothetical protein RLZZ324_74, partial [Candidatus Parcubacteria bacterium]